MGLTHIIEDESAGMIGSDMSSRILTSASIGLFVLCAILLSCTATEERKVAQTEFVFGTPCTITLYGKGAENDAKQVFERILELDAQLSTHRSDSVIALVNGQAGSGAMKIPDEMFFIIRTGIAYSQLSEGAFDISIGPLVNLWGIATEQPTVPSEADIGEVLSLVDYRKIVLIEQEKSVILEKDGMALDLGGIAKGYAADEVISMLKGFGREQGLLNFGGNVAAFGTKPDGSRWRVGIQHPDEPRGTSIGIIEIVDRTIVTSGKYERFFVQDGVRYHHILDTQTGHPIENGIASVTIVTDSSLKADALSTAVFALGFDRGFELVEGFEGVEAIFIMENRTIFATRGVKDQFILIDSRYSLKDTP